MIKRIVALLLSIAVLVLAGCSERTDRGMDTPVMFYYCARNVNDAEYYENPVGALDWEYKDIGDEWPPLSQMIDMLLEGPVSAGLYCPFPDSVRVVDVSLENGTLNVVFNDALSEISGIDMTLSAACLVHTMSQYPGVEAVQMNAEKSVLSGLVNVPLEISDFLRQDDYISDDSTLIRLYFPQKGSLFLRGESRLVQTEDEQAQAEYVMRELLSGSSRKYAMPVFFEGTELLNISSSNGFCVVDLSSSFLTHAPESSLDARLQIMAIVNSLTDIDGITYVQLLCDGQKVSAYGPLQMPTYLTRDESANEAADPSAVRPALLYLPAGTDGMLASVPVNVKETAGAVFEKDVLLKLISCESLNGYSNAVPKNTAIVDITCAYKLCTVTLSSEFLKCDTNDYLARTAVRSIVSTLCALDTVDRVRIIIDNGEMQREDLSQVYTADDTWIMP